MKSINRITTSLFLTAFSFLFAFSQTIDIGRSLEKPAPAVAPNLPPTHFNQVNQPQCAFDAANQALYHDDPHLKQEIQQYVKNAVPVLAAGNQTEMVEELLSISVVVHIIHSGEPIGQGQNLTDDQVYAQIAILNQDFAGINSEYFQTPTPWASVNGVPNIEFCLASVDPSDNPTNGITRHNLQVTGTSYNNSNINSSIKPQTDWNSTKYMNVWVLPIPGTSASGGVVGVANYPTPSQIGQERDGIVIDYRWFGAPGFANSGYRPLTHETGHFLGLPHTFDDFSCAADDGISDTPNIDDATANYVDLDCTDGYPDGPLSCGNEAMYVNYMDYVDENCYTSFTQGQVNVMRAVLNGTSQGYGYGSRLSLLQNAPQLCVLPNNDAGIARIVSPDQVTCTAGPVLPVITLRNFGQADLTSVSIKYKAGNGTLMTHNWQGSLFPGENADVTLPAIALPDGLHDLIVFTSNPNGMADGRAYNDTLIREQINYLAGEPNLIESFEDDAALPSNEGLYALDVSGDGYKWQLNSQVSGYGLGSKSVVFNNFQNGPEGTLDGLVTRHYNLTNIDDAILVFDVAYAQKSLAESDSLIILVQIGCSQLYDLPIYWKGGASLATAPNTSSQFTPSPTQWRTEALDLSVFAGESDISFAFINLSGGGNRLFLDNIRFGRSCSAITTEFAIQANGCSPNGFCTGSAQVFVENDHGGLHYQWSGQSPSYNEDHIEGLCTGAFTLTITDAFGCQLIATEEIPQSEGPSLIISSTPEATYNGLNGTATVTVGGGSGPYDYFWSNGTQEMNSNNTVSTISNLPPGTYSVTVEDANQCTSNSQVAVTSICTGFSVSTQTTNATCNGASNGSITAMMANGTSPYSFIWNNGNTSAMNSGLPAGPYSVTVTDANGCPTTQNATISQPTPLLPNAVATNETMANANDGSVSVMPSGSNPPYQVMWNTGSNSFSITGLAPGDYTATVTDNAGCTASASVTVQSVGCSSFQADISSSNVSCNGANDGVATVNIAGAQEPVSIFWNNFFISPTITNLAPGDYSVSVTDALGCNTTVSTIITEPAVLQLNTTASDETSVSANDGTAQASASGGTMPYTYLWSNGMVSASISNLPPGNYSVTITDANNCTKTAAATVAAFNCSLQINLTSQDASCPNTANGSAQVTNVPGGSGPFEYLWSNGGTSATAPNLLPGNYGVTVTDANGCTITSLFEILGEDAIAPNAVVVENFTLELDENGLATLTADMVDNGSADNCSLVSLTLSQESFECSDIGEHTVTLTVEDANGNANSAALTLMVVDETAPQIQCPADVFSNSCNGVSYELPSTSDNCLVADLDLVQGLPSGEVFPLGETMVEWQASDASGNQSSCIFSVFVETDISIANIEITDAIIGQSNGAITASVVGGNQPYVFQWFQNGNPLPNFDPQHVAEGLYDLIVMDATGCTDSVSDIEVNGINASQEKSGQEEIAIYPNPSTGLVFIEFKNGRQDFEVELCDVSGKILSVGKINPGTLDISTLASGIYWLKIVAKEQLIWKKIAKI